MTSHVLVRLFLMTANAAIPLGIGLFLASSLMKHGGRRKSGARRILECAAALGPFLLLPAAKILAPSLSFSLFKIPSQALYLVPLASGSTTGKAMTYIPTVATPVISPLWTWTAAAWAAVAAWLILRLVLSLRTARRINDRAAEVGNERILALFSAAARWVDCRRPIALKVSREASCPFSLGLFRASIILPEEMMSWPDSELRGVLCHELAHVKNGDLVRRLAVRLTCALMWFNPAAWLALRRLAAVQERESDRVAVGSGVLPSQYAGILLKTLWRNTGRTFSAAPALNPGSDLKVRIRSILEPDPPRPGQAWRRAGKPLLIFVFTAAAALLDVWDISSTRPRNIEVIRVRGGDVSSRGESSARPQPRVRLDEGTHRWTWE